MRQLAVTGLLAVHRMLMRGAFLSLRVANRLNLASTSTARLAGRISGVVP